MNLSRRSLTPVQVRPVDPAIRVVSPHATMNVQTSSPLSKLSFGISVEFYQISWYLSNFKIGKRNTNKSLFFLVPNLNDSDMPQLVNGNGKTSTTTISTIAVQSGKARIIIALLQAGSKMSFKVIISKHIHIGCKPYFFDFYI